MSIVTRPIRTWLLVMLAALALLGFAANASAQLTGTLNIPGDYATLAEAITALNAQGVAAGGVTLNLVAGNPQTAPAGGYVVGGTGSLVLTTTSAANQVVIEGNGNVITASGALTVGALNDAIFKLIGADWITVSGFTMQENAANTVTTAASNNMTEWGVAVLYVAATDGAQNNTIQNNTITLNRTYQNTFGVYSNTRHTATAISTTADITAATGVNSNLHVYGNTISNVNTGIIVVGSPGSGFLGTGLDIGGTGAAMGNTISNYGTTGTFSSYVGVSGTVNGINATNQMGPNIAYNTITSSAGGVTAGTLRGIFLAASSSPTLPTVGSYLHNVSNNNIALRTGVASGTMEGIRNDVGNVVVNLVVNDNNFSDFTNASASPSGTITYIINSATTLNQTINNNTFTNMTVPTTGSVTFISNSVSATASGSKTINGNSIVTGFAKTGAGGTVTLYTDNGSSVVGATINNNNNNFSYITVTGATTIAGWSNTDGTTGPTKTFQGNVFSNWTGGTSAITALNVNYGTGNVFQNTISNITGGGAITGIAFGTSLTAGNATQNTINGLASTGASAVQGITTSAPIANVLRNKIYDLSGSNASSTVYGVTAAAGTTITIANNLIGDLRAPAATSTNDVVRGINMTANTTSSTLNVAYNTIYLNASSSGANFSTSGIFHTTSATATQAMLNLRNNVVVNLSTPNGTGVAAAYRRSSTTLTNYGSSSNNNLFYAGTPAANQVVFYDGTNADQTLPAFQTRVNPREASSVTENPTFLSTTGSSPNFLHIDPTVGTQVESGGQPIAGITEDYDGQTRNASTPDIGADEGTFPLADFTGPTIVYTPLPDTGLTGDRVLVATITDASGVPTAGLGLPVLYWRVNAGAYAPVTALPLGDNQFQFTFGAAAGGGDVVSYYVVAQDGAGTPNVSVNPSAGAADLTANPPAAGTPPTAPSSYNIVGSIAGTFSVGSGGDYPTLTAAVTDLNAKFMSGPVVFELTDATYSAETFPIVVNVNTGASAINTLTIRPAAGQAPVITGALSSGALIKLNGADYVTIDGSNAGGTDRSLTITNTGATAPCAIWIASLGNGAGAKNNTIRNCNLNASAATTATAYGISVSGAAIGLAGGDNDDVTLQNNAIASSHIGVYANGNAAVSTGGMDNLVVTGNTISVSSTSSPVYGIEVGSALNAAVNRNILGLTTSYGTTPVGISIEINVSNSSVSNNRITGVVTTSTSGYGGRGITVGTNTTSSNITVANNFVAGVNGSNYSSFGNSSSMGIGIGMIGNSGTLTTITGGVKLYHNSVNMAGSYSYSSACLTAGLYVGSGASALDVRNNIIVNALNNTSNTSSKSYAVYSAATSTAYAPISYNDYYVSGTQGVLGYLGGDQATLSAFNTAFTGSASTPALNVAAPFTTPTDLHLPAATTSLLESFGASGTGIVTDIDDDVRPGPAGSVNGGATAPDLGADEFDGTPVVANDMAATAFVDPLSGGTKSVGVPFAPRASFTNLGTAAQTNVTVRYRIVGPSPSGAEVYNETATIASIASMAVTTVTFPDVTLNAGGSYAIYAAAELAGDGTPGNDQITGAMSVLTPLSGTYLVGVGAFKDLAGLDVTFERHVRTVTREALEPVESTDKNVSPEQMQWKLVSREVEEEYWVPMVDGEAYDLPLRVSRQENGALPAWSRDGAYPTITAAVADLNARGVEGPVQFLLTDATYPTESFPITVNVTSGAPNATNTVTFKPNAGVTAAVTGASASGAIFKVINTNYVTIDGSNVVTGTSRDLTLENTSTTSPQVVWFGSSGTTPITNGSLKNCVVRNGVNTSSAVVISDGATAGNAGYFTNMEVRNNKIEKAYIGVYANGGTTPANGSGLSYAGNELNTSGTNAIANVGLYMQGVNGGLVAGNDVGNFDGTGGQSDAGIWLATGTSNVTVNANRVHDIRYTGTSGYGGRGIAVSTALADAAVTVTNNMIFNITGDGDSYTSFGCQYTPVGIYAYGSTVQGGLGIYDNSIYLYGNTINYSSAAYSVGIGLDDAATATVSGNNVVNNLGRLSATGAGAAAIALETGASQLVGGDYNNLFANATGGGTNLVGKIGANNYATMDAWRTASGRDAASITADPQYVGNADLHVRNDVLSPVSNAGAPIAGVTNDYDGDLRTATPDIGADEFTVFTLATAVVGNGTITADPALPVYAPGTTVSLTAVPTDDCQVFAGWSGDATGTTNPLTVVMDGDKHITATFVTRTSIITATAGAGGTIDPAGEITVNCGTDQTFSITPAANFHVADVLVDGVSVGAVASYTFNGVTANHTIAATFAPSTFTITATAGAGGTIDPDGAVVVNAGSAATFTIAPASCYRIADVLVDGISVGAVASYTFEDVAADHTIEATFAQLTYTISASAGPDGSITPNGAVTVNCGADQSFTIAAAANFHVADVLVDGVSVGAVTSYTFNGVSANHTIEASFAATTFTIAASAGTGGTIDPSGTITVNGGDDATFTVTPEGCYRIADVLVDGVSMGAVASYTFEDVAANHTIEATFAQLTYTITASAGAGGSINPSGAVTVNCGADQSFTIAPNPYFQVANVLVDGVLVGAVTTYTFNGVSANHTIEATFVATAYTITAMAGAGGSIDPSGSVGVNGGDDVTFTIAPASCYRIADVLVDGVSVGAVASYAFNAVAADHTIEATFAQLTYTITASAGPNGSITPIGAVTVNCGADQSFTITPASCHRIADVLVDGVSVGAVTSYTFEDVAANHTIDAAFAQLTYTITASAGPNGSIDPNGAVTVVCGADQAFTITPAANFHVADVLVDGISVGAVTSYVFNNVAANHTIEATFAATTFTITATAGAGGAIDPSGAVVVGGGADATFTITPASCYRIADVLVDGVSVGVVATYTFSNVTADHTIAATFLQDVYTITVTAGAGGVVDPNGTVTVPCGSDQTFTITPDPGFGVVDVLVDGVSVGAVTTYTFTQVSANHTLAVTFTDDQCPQVTVVAPNGGEELIDAITYLQWTATDNIGVTCVDLLLSRTGVNGPYEAIATCVENTGSFAWMPTGPISDDAYFKVVAHDAAGHACEDVSDGPFSLTEAVGIMLADFRASGVDDGVEVRWTLAEGIAVLSAVVERSNDHAGPWAAVNAASRLVDGAYVLVDDSAAFGQTYWYRLTATTRFGQTISFEPQAVEAGSPILEFSLPTVAPNPVQWPALVSFAVPRQSHVRVTVYDVKGRLVTTLADRNFAPGRYQVTWAGDGQATRMVSGIYFVRLETPDKVLTRRVVNVH